MTMKELVSAIEKKHKTSGITINPPASVDQVRFFEKKTGFGLPADFKEFYSVCNGFECDEDLFRIIQLKEIIELSNYGKNWFHFAEYMIYSDSWSLRKTQQGQFEIFIKGPEIILTNSLGEFLDRFLQGNVFDKNGLYEWQEELNKLKG